MRRKTRLLAACGLLYLAIIIPANANPMRRLKRGEDDSDLLLFNTTLLLGPQSVCTVGDIVYQIGESVPGSGPCEKCTCFGQSEDGTGVNCQAVQCEVKAGCKALHRADHCCPLYQCECTRNGKVYSNGEKLEDPENPCEVCYCQGGEIVCNRIACFIRNDCEPVYVEGSCCPEYDHCPPRDPEKETVKDKIVSFLSDSPSKQESKEPSKLDMNKLPKIQIKEVTQGKPIYNEIRIKEVIPVSTKAPTFPREVQIIYKSEDENQTKNDLNVEESQKDVSVPSQILRVGDQLLFVKQGEVVPENNAAVTPSPVFTVIGAEGLQRVEEDSEDISEKELSGLNTTSRLNDKDQPIVPVDEETEGLDKMIQETISELYASTTKEALNDTNDQEYFESEQNIYKDTNTSSSSTEIYITDEPKVSPIEDDIQAVPIEHLPEHNPEYPPIPEDIMILSMTEDPLDHLLSEIENINNENPQETMKSKDDEKIVIVKRPVIPLTVPKHQKNAIILRDDNVPEKILPDILPFIRGNKTNEGANESFVPEEWLKEGTESPAPELSSPLLTLEATLPESILSVPSKSSAEEDDSKEYIFITNETSKINEQNNNKTEFTTVETFTEVVTIDGEYRSPGEPYLVPEWERNQTSENKNTDLKKEANYTELSPQADDLSITNITDENNTTDNEVDDGSELQDEISSMYNNSQVSIESNISDRIDDNETKLENFYTTSDSDKFDPLENEVTTSSANSEYSTSNPFNIPKVVENDDKSTNVPQENERFSTSKPFSSLNEDIYPPKQKKNSALIGEKNPDSGKKHNILADLINLVGDVAAMGHENEVSTVSNSIDTKEKSSHKHHNKINNPTLDKDYNIVSLDNVAPHFDNIQDNTQMELTEYNASGDKIDSEFPMENDKVEYTTRKILIDKEMDEKQMFEPEKVDKDIELIPKVENNPPKKDPSLEKIKEANNIPQNKLSKNKVISTTQKKGNDDDVIIYTTVQVNPLPEQSTAAPNKTKVKPNDFPETLISVETDNKFDTNSNKPESDTTENSFSSTIMKVTGRIDNGEEAANIRDAEGDKVAKRETNYQSNPKDIIDDKYLDALKSYFERRFIH